MCGKAFEPVKIEIRALDGGDQPVSDHDQAQVPKADSEDHSRSDRGCMRLCENVATASYSMISCCSQDSLNLIVHALIGINSSHTSILSLSHTFLSVEKYQVARRVSQRRAYKSGTAAGKRGWTVVASAICE